MTPRAFKKRLALLLFERDVSQNALAKKLGTTPSTVNAWISLKNQALPEGKLMIKLPKVLACSGHWLLTGEGHMDQEPGQGFRDGVRKERERVRKLLG